MGFFLVVSHTGRIGDYRRGIVALSPLPESWNAHTSIRSHAGYGGSPGFASFERAEPQRRRSGRARGFGTTVVERSSVTADGGRNRASAHRSPPAGRVSRRTSTDAGPARDNIRVARHPSSVSRCFARHFDSRPRPPVVLIPRPSETQPLVSQSFPARNRPFSAPRA